MGGNDGGAIIVVFWCMYRDRQDYNIYVLLHAGHAILYLPHMPTFQQCACVRVRLLLNIPTDILRSANSSIPFHEMLCCFLPFDLIFCYRSHPLSWDFILRPLFVFIHFIFLLFVGILSDAFLLLLPPVPQPFYHYQLSLSCWILCPSCQLLSDLHGLSPRSGSLTSWSFGGIMVPHDFLRSSPLSTYFGFLVFFGVQRSHYLWSFLPLGSLLLCMVAFRMQWSCPALALLASWHFME